jgi:Na+-transporting methylmalonyl-CoA/oxaloacetate decarboxylase gamma subunit
MLGTSTSAGCSLRTFLITGVANKRFMVAFLCVAFVLFFLTFLLSLVTAMVYLVSR